MAKLSRNFIAGRMNKVVDERLVPEGEYIDAMNIRMGSTENSEVGVIENTKGNVALTNLTYIDGTPLSVSARCIGAIEDSAKENIYWFVHDPAFTGSATGKLDLILSYNTYTDLLLFHIVSINDGNGLNTTLNFNPAYLITGVNIIEDLLFFTDDYNPPRFINVKSLYANPVMGVDGFSAESILVIKKPPTEAPKVQPIVTSSQSNYMDTRFICFAYRYKYANGEYSATSQWSAPSFIPKPFSFTPANFLNGGMTNLCNTAIVTYNSGGPLVVAVDLLFKQSSSNIIKVIEKLNKKNLGLVDYVDYTFTFNNSKIFTVLPESELLRLYDNVPRVAKAQTIMGNRLMYGNYLEGYNLIDHNGNPIKLEYSTKLITEPIGLTTIGDTTAPSNYNINGAQTITDSLIEIDLAGANLVEGASLSMQITISHSLFTGQTPFPAETTGDTRITFSFFLNKSYTSVYQMATSSEFQDAVGTALNIKPVFSSVPGTMTSCDGVTFTDAMNCALPNNLDALTKFSSGINTGGQPITIITSPASKVIGFQVVAMRYVNNTTTPIQNVYEYYQVSYVNATFQEIGSPRSLHSNRGYEVGIVYMDEYLRASTTLVSPVNTVHVPCGYSANKNSIQVTIPPTQIAPAWAKRYKFVIQPDQENYETIYCYLYFADPNTNEVYFLLEGENARKVETGDILIVKADTNGPTNNCVYATVLEKKSQASAFISPVSKAIVPAGVYMKINPNDFAVVEDPNAVIAPGQLSQSTNVSGNYPVLSYPMNIPDPNVPGQYIDYTVPAGSRIRMSIRFERKGGTDNGCPKRIYQLDKTYISSAAYDNMEDWFVGDNIKNTLNDGVQDIGGGNCPAQNIFISGHGPITVSDLCINYYRFNRDISNNYLYLQIKGTRSCGGFPRANRWRSTVTATFEIFRAENLLVFETQPSESLPDVFFENDLSFSIDDNGNHSGNVQNQDIAYGVPAIVNTGFFNCFAFGNGVESYKIQDSIIGKTFNLGNRVTSVSAQDYKASNRFSDITYSGVYNTESNVNKLNEFNLGLLDYKHLEVSFGPIFVMDGRETDVLVLQEDKISYVLAGKNLLSDSAGGNAVTSVPEVLGTQIARTEKYGISFNPESYVQWGFDRFFTDVKRGVVVQLQGNSYSNEQLKIVSEQNMRTWFRDEFIASFNTQKLGGFDPYMNEYVLSNNDILLPTNPQCSSCGINQVHTLRNATNDEMELVYCVTLGPTIGDTVVSWTVTSIEPDADGFNISADYNGDTVSSGYTTTDGSITFYKDTVSVETVSISIKYKGSMVLNVLADCCNAETLTVVQVVFTNNSDSGMTTHNQYRYTSGSYVGPLQSNLVLFPSGTSSPLVASYGAITGYVGTGSIPPEGSNMSLIMNQISPDDYVFNPLSDEFKYLRSNTLYNNNSTDMQTLLSLSTTATPIVATDATTYQANFAVPSRSLGGYLYLIWDLRDSIPTSLCYAENINDVCCTCAPCTTVCQQYNFQNLSSVNEASVYLTYGRCEDTGPVTITLEPGETYSTCVNTPIGETNIFEVSSGNVYVTILDCICI